MNVVTFKGITFIEELQKEPLCGGSFHVRVKDAEDGQIVKIVRNGINKEENTYYVKNEEIIVNLGCGNYTLFVGTGSADFLVCERDHRLYLRRKKEDPEKALEKVYLLCVEMMKEIERQNKEIDNLSGYETE